MSQQDQCECCGKECKCGLRFRETWSAGSIYHPGDAVPFNGSSYVAIHPNQNDPPPSPNWALIASKGDQGPAGQVGAAGPAGPPSQDGATEAYVANTTTVNSLTPAGNQIASLSLPSGSYLITGTFCLINTDTDSQSWVILVKTGDRTLLNANGTLESIDSKSNQIYVPLTMALTVGEPVTLTFMGTGYNVVPVPPVIVALKVGTLHGDSIKV
jgi:hypothetical protein